MRLFSLGAMSHQLKTGLSIGMMTCFFANNVLFAQVPEKGFWESRKMAARAGGRSSDNPLLLAPWGPSAPPMPWGQTSLAESAGRESLRNLGTRGSPQLSSLVSLLSRHGTVHRIQPGPENAPLIVHIQDVHGQRKAQENLALILTDILEKYPESPVGLEGAEAKDLDLSPFRRSSAEANAETGRLFFQTGYLTGPELPVFTSKTLPRYFGLEDPGLYLANVAAVKWSLSRQGRWQQRLSAWTASLEKEKDRCFSPPLKKFNQQVLDRDAGRVGLGDFVDYLVRSGSSSKKDRYPEVSRFVHLVRLEKGLDFTRVEAERNRVLNELVKRLSTQEIQVLVDESVAYRTGEIPYTGFYRRLRDYSARAGLRLDNFPAFNGYVNYTVEADSIRPERLLAEVHQLEQVRWAEALRTPAQRDIYQADQSLRTARALIGLRLTPETWKEFVSLRRSGVYSLPVRFGEDPLGWRNDLHSFETFYEKALARNRALAEAVKKKISDGTKGNGPVVFVAGGFHSEGLNRLLKGKGRILTVSPKLDLADPTGGDYLSVFTREKLPLESLFDSPKIALVDTPAVAPIDGSKQAVAILAGPVESAVQTALDTGAVAVGHVRDLTITCSPGTEENIDSTGPPPLLSGHGEKTRIAIRNQAPRSINSWVFGLNPLIEGPFLAGVFFTALAMALLVFFPQGFPFLMVFGAGITPAGRGGIPPFWNGVQNDLQNTLASVDVSLKTLEGRYPKVVPWANLHVRSVRHQGDYDVVKLVNDCTQWPVQAAILLVELRCQLTEVQAELHYAHQLGHPERLRRTSDLFGKTFYGVSSVLHHIEQFRVALSDPALPGKGRSPFVETLGSLSEAGMKLSNSVVEEADVLFDSSIKIPSLLLEFIHFLAEKTHGIEYTRMPTYRKFAYLFEAGVWAAGSKRSPLTHLRENINPLFHQFYRQNAPTEQRGAAVPDFGYEGFRLLLRLRGGLLYDELKTVREEIDLEYKSIYPELLKVARLIPDSETAEYFLSVLDHDATGLEQTFGRDEFMTLVGGVWGKWFRAQGYGDHPQPRFEDLRHFVLLAPQVQETIAIRLSELAEGLNGAAKGRAGNPRSLDETTGSGRLALVAPPLAPMTPRQARDQVNPFVGTNRTGVLKLLNSMTGVIEIVAATIRSVRYSKRFNWTLVEFGKMDTLLAAKELLIAISGRRGVTPEAAGWGPYAANDVLLGSRYSLVSIEGVGEEPTPPPLGQTPPVNDSTRAAEGWEIVRLPGTSAEAGKAVEIAVAPRLMPSPPIQDLKFTPSADDEGNLAYVVPVYGNSLSGFTFSSREQKWTSADGTYELNSFVGRVPNHGNATDGIPSMWFGFEARLPRVPGFVGPSHGFFNRVRHVWTSREGERTPTAGLKFTRDDRRWVEVSMMPAIPKGSLMVLLATDPGNSLFKCILTPDGQLYLTNPLEGDGLASLQTVLGAVGVKPVVWHDESKLGTRTTYAWNGFPLLQVQDPSSALRPSDGQDILCLNVRRFSNGDGLILTPEGPLRLQRIAPPAKEVTRLERGPGTGGSWFGHPFYKKWAAWMETPFSFLAGGLASLVLAPLGFDSMSIQMGVIGTVSALVFWLPHPLLALTVFGNRGSYRDSVVLQLTALTFLVGALLPLMGLGVFLPAVLLAGYHLRINAPLQELDTAGVTRYSSAGETMLGNASTEKEFEVFHSLLQNVGPLQSALTKGFDPVRRTGELRFLAQLGVLEQEKNKKPARQEIQNLFELGERLGYSPADLRRLLRTVHPRAGSFHVTPTRRSVVPPDLGGTLSGTESNAIPCLNIGGLEESGPVGDVTRANLESFLAPSLIEKALVLRVDPAVANPVLYAKIVLLNEGLSTLPKHLRLVIVRSTKLTQENLRTALTSAWGKDVHVGLFKTASTSGLDSSLSAVIEWLLENLKTRPYSETTDGHLWQERVFASQA